MCDLCLHALQLLAVCFACAPCVSLSCALLASLVCMRCLHAGHFGVQAHGRVQGGTGVWVGSLKVAAIGVKISHGVRFVCRPGLQAHFPLCLCLRHKPVLHTSRSMSKPRVSLNILWPGVLSEVERV